MSQQLLNEYNRLVSTFKKGEKYTLFYFGEFGFPVTLHATIENAFIKPYAQYDNALRIHYKPKRKRTVYEKVVYDSHSVYVWEGWHNIEDEIYTSTEKRENGTLVRTSMLSFDKRYIEKALKSTNFKPDYILDRDYYTNIDEVEFIYKIVFADGARYYNSKEILLSYFEMTGECESTVVRKELKQQPILKGVGGAMWDGYADGKATIRYECSRTFDDYMNVFNNATV